MTPDPATARLRAACHWARIRHPAFAQVLAPALGLRPVRHAEGPRLTGATIDNSGTVEVHLEGRQIVATLIKPGVTAIIRATLPALLCQGG